MRNRVLKKKEENVVRKEETLIRSVLAKNQFGLASDEVSKKIGLTHRSTQKLLDGMTKKKKILRTRAGRTFFYRVIAVFILLAAAVHAQELDSDNYKIVAEIFDAAGGNVTSPSNATLLLSLSHVSSIRYTDSYQLCAGFLCSFWDLVSGGRVTFVLSFNLNGSEQAYVDNYTEPGRYGPGELTNYYACAQDTSVSGNPVLGIIFAGSQLDYISATPGSSNSANLKLSQDIPGNKFIIPVTEKGCTIINPRMSQITQYGTILQPFVLFSEAVNSIELALDYNAFQLAGSFDKTGPFTLVIEKNLSDEKQIIIKPE